MFCGVGVRVRVAAAAAAAARGAACREGVSGPMHGACVGGSMEEEEEEG